MAEQMKSLATNSSANMNASVMPSGGFRIALQKPGILLASEGGLNLPVEICLKIVEEVVSLDTKVGSWALKAVSKVRHSAREQSSPSKGTK